MKRFLARALALVVFCASIATSAAAPPPAFVFVNNANSTLAAPANAGASTMTMHAARWGKKKPRRSGAFV